MLAVRRAAIASLAQIYISPKRAGREELSEDQRRRHHKAGDDEASILNARRREDGLPLSPDPSVKAKAAKVEAEALDVRQGISPTRHSRARRRACWG